MNVLFAAAVGAAFLIAVEIALVILCIKLNRQVSYWRKMYEEQLVKNNGELEYFANLLDGNNKKIAMLRRERDIAKKQFEEELENSKMLSKEIDKLKLEYYRRYRETYNPYEDE